MRPAFLGIIGCGAMGRLIARHIREQLPSYRLGGLFSRTTAHAEGLALELGDVPVLSLQQLIETCDLLVEATSAAAMPDIVRACLAAGKAVVPLSVGGFSLDPALLRDVEAARAAVHVPSGAIAGLDGIRAMREMGLDAVTLTTVKHPRSLGQMPPLSELIPPTAEEALIMSPEARLLFSGTAEEAIRPFPRKRERRGQPRPGGARFFPYAGAPVRGSLCGRDAAPYFGQGRGLHIGNDDPPGPVAPESA